MRSILQVGVRGRPLPAEMFGGHEHRSNCARGGSCVNSERQPIDWGAGADEDRAGCPRGVLQASLMSECCAFNWLAEEH